MRYYRRLVDHGRGSTAEVGVFDAALRLADRER